jgi:hypothetical protein
MFLNCFYKCFQIFLMFWNLVILESKYFYNSKDSRYVVFCSLCSYRFISNLSSLEWWAECSTTVLLSWPAAVVHFVLSIEIPTKPMRVFTKCIKNDFFCYFSSLYIIRKLVFIKLSLKELSWNYCLKI